MELTPAESKPGLTRERVIAAALAMVDRDGLDALTMRGLGRELGVDAMAPYHHIPNKEALLDGVVEAVWSELDPSMTGDTWQEQLKTFATHMMQTLQKHPRALPAMASRPNRSSSGYQRIDLILGVLLDAGFEARDALNFVNTAGSLLIGHAISTTEVEPSKPHPDSHALPEMDEAIPNISRVSKEIDMENMSKDDVFKFGIGLLITGMEARLPK